ncbi:VWA domain-containing protein [Nannocystis bainbridge]|uniref:VWA domain-containing protein n=1 Tax=Nannocystis bainbridge TaxID=2995303 RepID=A0ABT5E924_9BACT|nr:VWA domain-containing protein [Nannocystis bainbridge]MDC0722361.1 VWA domain-containing protein [Nannocystis bainbridge]
MQSVTPLTVRIRRAFSRLFDSRRIGRSIALGAALSVPLIACTSLTLTRLNSAQKKPNNVWVFFTVEQNEEPVAGLQAEDFQIYEDGDLVSTYESKQVIQNPEVAAVMYTMLLLDVSGSVSESGSADQLVDAAQLFTDRVGKTQKVGVYAFDGEKELHSVTPFTESEGAVSGGLDGLRTYKPKDPSTNLHGAVMEGLKELKKSLDKEKKPLKFGTLVVFTDGTDRAARFSREDMKGELLKEQYKDYEIYAIGVGAEIKKAGLGDIGRDGTELATEQTGVKTAFEKVADRIERHTKRFYLLSYCTPARKGTHTVRIVANSKSPKGSGQLEWDFNADGFGPPPECDPNTPPVFPLKTGEIVDTGKIQGDSGSGGKVKVKASASASAG